MPAILPKLKVESERPLSRVFLPYQCRWILDDSPLRLAEKSVRIGWTYADACKNVRKRLRCPRRDYLFTTKDHPTAVEYVQTCYRVAGLFNVARFIRCHGLEDWRIPRFDAAGRATGFTEQLKVGLIKFDNGSRILAFSSNPNALRAFGGDVGLDEFAFHPAAEELWAAASGRVTWGYDLGLWSSCNGDDTLFHTFAREARAQAEAGPASNPAEGRGWSYYRVTLPDAVELGLVEKINQVRGCHWTPEQFIQDCRHRARLPEIFEQEYLCLPRGGVAAIVPWVAIARCQQDYPISRLHLEAAQIEAAFGEYAPASQPQREARIGRCLEAAFAAALGANVPYCFGFDVAASGAGDLAAIYVDERAPGALRLGALFTCRTQDWHFLKTALFFFLRRLKTATACGDETGLGRQICWEAAKQFPGRFVPVNFRAEKHRLGFVLMSQLTMAEKQFPREQPDVAADFYALRKTYRGGQWTFGEGANPLNSASHCDIAWAGALSSHAAGLALGAGPALVRPRLTARQRARRARTVL